MEPQTWTFATLVAALVLFAGGWWRYDLVALLALLTLTLAGVVSADAAFDGFGHSAVVTVAAVLVVSRGLQNAGVVELLTRPLSRVAGMMSRIRGGEFSTPISPDRFCRAQSRGVPSRHGHLAPRLSALRDDGRGLVVGGAPRHGGGERAGGRCGA